MYVRHPGRCPPAAAALLVALLLAGCSGSDADTSAEPAVSAGGPATSMPASPGSPAPPDMASEAASSPGVPTTPPATPSAREIVVTISDGQVQPPPGRIEVSTGETVRITVTSDVADELHVHGFGDPELTLAAGVPGSLDIVADEPGQYDIETHESELVLFQLLVR